MENLVNRSKYVIEAISIIASFADLLAPNETIQGVPTISINLDTGYDPDPAALLLMGPHVGHGVTVEQRFHRGVAGVIYAITYEVVTNFGNTFTTTVYLAVLPNPGAVIPDVNPFYETSQLYPYIFAESFQVGVSLGNGGFLFNPTTLEQFQISMSLGNGSLILHGAVSYSFNENIQTSFSIGNGLLVGTTNLQYSFYESLKIHFSIGNGTLAKVVVSYNYSYESFQVSMTIGNGSLS